MVDIPGDDINVGFVRVFLQQADGSYPAVPINYSLGSGAIPLGIAVGDFNGDGHRDVAVMTLLEVLKTIGFVAVMYGQPGGTLSEPSSGYTNYSYPVEAQGLAIAAADLDADGKSELLLLAKNFVLPVPQLSLLAFQDIKTYVDKWPAQLLFGLQQIAQLSVADASVN